MNPRPYFTNSDGILEPVVKVTHRDDEYSQSGFETLRIMQEEHFWYKGRHKFILGALEKYMPKDANMLSGIDLGGGVGGWIRDLCFSELTGSFERLALADSSLIALRYAQSVVPESVERYQVDLMNLQMENEWDVAFLLDVIEHLPDDKKALEQTKRALKPGGMLFVTTPAFPQFWSYNDELAHHQRRYTCSDYEKLAKNLGFKLLDARYFMFFLSPLYLVSRFKPGLHKLSTEQKKDLVLKQHQIPSKPVNSILSAIFNGESPLGHWVRFPWGTSILGVFQK